MRIFKSLFSLLFSLNIQSSSDFFLLKIFNIIIIEDDKFVFHLKLTKFHKNILVKGCTNFVTFITFML